MSELHQRLLGHVPEDVSSLWVGETPSTAFPEGAPSMEFGLSLIKGRKATEVREIVAKFRNTELLDEIARTDRRLRTAHGLIDSCHMSLTGYLTVLENHNRRATWDRIAGTMHPLTAVEVVEHFTPEQRNALGSRQPVLNLIAERGLHDAVTHVIESNSATLAEMLDTVLLSVTDEQDGVNSNRDVVTEAIRFYSELGKIFSPSWCSPVLLDSAPDLVESLIRLSVTQNPHHYRSDAMQLLNELPAPPTGPVPVHGSPWVQACILAHWSSCRPLSLAEYEEHRPVIEGDLDDMSFYVTPEARIEGKLTHPYTKNPVLDAVHYLATLSEPSAAAIRNVTYLWRGQAKAYTSANEDLALAKALLPHLGVTSMEDMYSFVRVAGDDLGKLDDLIRLSKPFCRGVAAVLTQRVDDSWFWFGRCRNVDLLSASTDRLIDLHEAQGLSDDALLRAWGVAVRYTNMIGYHERLRDTALLRLASVDVVQLLRVLPPAGLYLEPETLGALHKALRELDIDEGEAVLQAIKTTNPWEWSNHLDESIRRFPDVVNSRYVTGRSLMTEDCSWNADVSAAISAVFTDAFGDDTSMWELAIELLPEWDEPVPDLIETVCASQA